MGLNCGIVGLPNVGKSTIFTALTSAKAEAANYPFCTIEPNIGMVAVPDSRLDFLSTLYTTAKIIPAVVEFVDIAGIVKGASQGAGLGNQFLSHIRKVDAVVHVVRCFDSDDVIHVDGSVSPVRDVETIVAELCLADLDSVAKRIAKSRKNAKSRDKEAVKEVAVLEQLEKLLNEGRWIYNGIDSIFDESEMKLIQGLHLLTVKPMIFLGNVSEEKERNVHLETLEQYCRDEGFQCLSICGKIEEELSGLDGEEKMEFLQELGISISGIDRLVCAAYETLGLITFITAGDKELRAWTVRDGAFAPEAAGVIHSDFERGFIRSETVSFEDIKKAGDYNNARAGGLVRSEGKDYLIKDGDIVHFRFNV